MKDNQTIHQPSPKPSVEHYTTHVIDLDTIVVIAHFIETDEGFEPRCGFSKRTLHLSESLFDMDSSYLTAPGNENFRPAGMSEFYSEVDDETHRELIKAQGEDPDETFARWAESDDDTRERFCGEWFSVGNILPDSDKMVLIHLRGGMVTVGRWRDSKWLVAPDAPTTFDITHWAKYPEGPIPF